MSIAKVAPWSAEPLAEAAKHAKFRRVMDLRAESVLLGRSAIIAGWITGAIGTGCFTASVVGWLYILLVILPAAASNVKFFEIDKSTGIIALPVGIEDAPKLFSEATDHQYLKRYLQACEAWVPEMDAENQRMCKLMSTPAEQVRYMVRHLSPTGPAKTLGATGHVSLDNFRYHRQTVDQTTATHRYWVQYDRTVWRDKTREPTKTWSATIDFQWHPELPMLPRDRDDNPGGFQALDYSASSDTADVPTAAETPK